MTRWRHSRQRAWLPSQGWRCLAESAWESLRWPCRAPRLILLQQSVACAANWAPDPLAQWHSDPKQLASATFDHASQRWWAGHVALESRSRLCKVGTARDMARLQSQGGPIANGWMSVLPSRILRTDIQDSDYRLLLRWWLGLPLLPLGCTLPGCPLCGEPVDPFGDHFVCCQQNGITRRHNALRDSLFEVLACVAIPSAKEVSCGTLHWPADILLLAWERGHDVAVDLTVTHPLGLSSHPLNVKNVAPALPTC